MSRAVWITATGNRIPIAEMTDLHLVNTLLMLSKRVHSDVDRAKWFPLIHHELFYIRKVVDVPASSKSLTDEDARMLVQQLEEFQQAHIHEAWAERPWLTRSTGYTLEQLEPNHGNLYKNHLLMTHGGQFWRCKHGNTGFGSGFKWKGCLRCALSDLRTYREFKRRKVKP
jgi:hypothetical protein